MARGDAALIHLSNIALSPEIMKTITCITIVICAMSVATSSLAQTVSLDSCRRMALRTNKSIRMADEAVQGAGYSRKAAQAAYLPGIDAGATYMYNQHKTSLLSEDAKLPTMYFNPLTGKYDYDVVLGLDGKPVINPENGMPIPEVVAVIPKDALTFDTRNVFAAAVSLTQPVYMGGKIRAYNKITRFAESLAESRKDTEATEVILTADQAYWQIVSLENKKKLALSYLSLLEKLSKDVSSLKKAGLATRSDELSVEVRLNEARMTLTQVEDGITLSKMNLAQICGVDMYREKQKVTRAEFLPTLAVTGNYMMSSPNVFNGFSLSPKGLFNVGVILKVPVFNWNDRSHKMKIAKADTRIAELELQEAREKIELQINQSVFYRRAAERKADMSVSHLP